MATPINIMVVDDEVGICQNVKKILAKGNFNVTSATSARKALELLAENEFELIISDIVMPEMNGLQFLKSLKARWPMTKAVMMTAYASTDTAVKAIRLGALDYLPKPFTPDELRTMVDQALSGKLIEAKVSNDEKASISVIDVDAPFDPDEVAQYTGDAYARSLGSSDMPVVEVKSSQPLEGFCQVGAMVCDIFKKLGATCKAGTKTNTCPQKKAKKGKSTKAKKTTDVKTLIGVDQPFNYDEVKAVTGPEYLNYLQHDGVVVPTYEQLKANYIALTARDRQGRGKDTQPVLQVVENSVLVIDDEMAVNNNIRKILAKKDYRVDQAATKEEALSKIAAKGYELVLLDLRIPGVQGLELLSAIRDAQPQARVIIVTGYASIDTAKEAARMGAVDYLPKPFTPGEIRGAAERAMQLAA